MTTRLVDPKTSLPSITDFPAITVEKVRYSDTDRQGHVNNLQFAAFFEAGRAHILHGDVDLSATGCFFVLAKATIVFVGELNWPGEVTIGTRIERVGTSSIIIEQAIFQEGRCAATSDSVMVQVDIASRAGAPLSDFARGVLTSLMGPLCAP